MWQIHLASAILLVAIFAWGPITASHTCDRTKVCDTEVSWARVLLDTLETRVDQVNSYSTRDETLASLTILCGDLPAITECGSLLVERCRTKFGADRIDGSSEMQQWNALESKINGMCAKYVSTSAPFIPTPDPRSQKGDSSRNGAPRGQLDCLLAFFLVVLAGIGLDRAL